MAHTLNGLRVDYIPICLLTLKRGTEIFDVAKMCVTGEQQNKEEAATPKC